MTQDLRLSEPGRQKVRHNLLPTPTVQSGMLACGLAAAILLWGPGLAEANLQRKFPAKRVEEAKKEQSSPKGPLIISISIASQRLTVYDQNVPIAHAPVSTGMAGHATPMGVFSVIQKQKWHQSNIYSGAPMPYMQRITWSGVAMHAGVLPGYPASHGCIRMPADFAVRLYGMTKMGARVFVTRDAVTPVEFTSPRLFTPKPQVAAQATSYDIATVAVGNRVASANRSVPMASNQSSMPVIVADASAGTRTDVNINTETHAAETSAAPAPSVPSIATADPVKLDSPQPPATPTDADASAPPSTTVDSKNADGTAEVSPSPKDKDTVQTGTTADAPKDGNASRLDDAAVPSDVPVPMARPQLATIKPGPISIFISKKLGQLYVRKGFDALFDSPVTVANPERPLGTHVFTATGFSDDHAAMTWLLVSLPNEAPKASARSADVAFAPSHKRRDQVIKGPVDVTPAETAAGALERIEIPQETRDRIADLLVPGSSLIISDKDFGSETGASGETDFIVLTR